MTLLLDTHTFLWFWWDDPQLSETARQAICDPTNRKLISTARSDWRKLMFVPSKGASIPFSKPLPVAVSSTMSGNLIAVLIPCTGSRHAPTTTPNAAVPAMITAT